MRRLRCLVRRHQWHTEWNLQTQGTDSECLRCGARRSTYPGDPNFKSLKRSGGDGGVSGDGGAGGDWGGSYS